MSKCGKKLIILLDERANFQKIFQLIYKKIQNKICISICTHIYREKVHAEKKSRGMFTN